MDLKILFDAVASLGMPVAVATVLIWHFIWQSRNQDRRNQQLMKELSRLREALERSNQSQEQDEHLARQNEKLVEAIRLREESSFDLVRQVLSVSIQTRSGDSPQQESSAGLEDSDGKLRQ